MGSVRLKSEDTIYYTMVEGEPGRPCLVFLHEALGCSALWRSFPEKLCRATGCSGLLYDRAGFGRSGGNRKKRTVNYLHSSALVELPEILDALIPGRPYILVGHSDGASISLMFGSERPALLKGIVSEAAHVFVERKTVEGIRETIVRYEQKELAGLYKYHGEKTDRVFYDWCHTWTSNWFSSWNIEYLLPSINVPLLVIQGDDDQFATEKQVESIVAGTSGNATSMLIKGCGHFPHLEQPELLLETMGRFVKLLL
ncbi:alpha/beta fold hydrolase [Desulforhopalus singaporensis]|uniref:Pimeloyl-ACP methyl ester carboxylesterase n=1 Tax=Desulforhopalus singaporensis TaxID=91360 RepID=A0A1H0QDL5_9BACT|nr:alpha/beta hydrolase [Desulforhopalus singaporensis]SDP15290.1 Pimeloyl-ACP methyl ester carboxylesterase [Desulforhopalus singaporensis]